MRQLALMDVPRDRKPNPIYRWYAIGHKLLRHYPSWQLRSYGGDDLEKRKQRINRQAISGFVNAMKNGVPPRDLWQQLETYKAYIHERALPDLYVMPPHVFAWGGRDAWKFVSFPREEAIAMMMGKTGCSYDKAVTMVDHLSKAQEP